MRIRRLICSAISMAALALSGCGGAGSNTPSAPTATPPASSTVVSGLASKGPINTGTVKVYAITDGVQGSVPLNQGQTDASGQYSIDIGTYKGPVMVEVTGGTFTDEVSGAQVSLKTPLRAVFTNATTSGKKLAAVTPLTDLACKKAQFLGGGKLTNSAIDHANETVSTTFQVSDIIATQPVSGGKDSEKKYAAACGSISQLVNNSKHAGESLDDALTRVMSNMESEIEHSGGLSDNSMKQISDATTEFEQSGKNKSGTTAPTPAPKSGVLKISTAGTQNVIGTADMTVALPAGVTVAADPATGEAAAGVVTVSGNAAGSGSQLVLAKYNAASGNGPGTLQIGMISTTGFSPGECLTIDFDMTTGAAFPASATDFKVSNFSAKGLDAALLSGLSAAPSSLTGI